MSHWLDRLSVGAARARSSDDDHSAATAAGAVIDRVAVRAFDPLSPDVARGGHKQPAHRPSLGQDDEHALSRRQVLAIAVAGTLTAGTVGSLFVPSSASADCASALGNCLTAADAAYASASLGVLYVAGSTAEIPPLGVAVLLLGEAAAGIAWIAARNICQDNFDMCNSAATPPPPPPKACPSQDNSCPVTSTSTTETSTSSAPAPCPPGYDFCQGFCLRPDEFICCETPALYCSVGDACCMDSCALTAEMCPD